jgi:choline monooxygenase
MITKEKLLEDTTRVRAPREQARHVPGYFYTSPEVYALEREAIFMKEWLCVGRCEEIEKPGDYLTLRVADEPIVVCRDDDGELNAFYNVCAHRGTEVVMSPCGNAKRFSCPYHGWTYDLKGKLAGAAYMQDVENFQKSDYGLTPIRVDTWGGFVFVNFDPKAPSLIEWLGDFPDVYGPYRPEECRLAAKFTLEYDCNWKLLSENLVDIYHLATLHANTLGPHQPLESYEFMLTNGGYHGYFRGRTQTPDGKSLFGPMPWVTGRLLEGGYSSHLRPNMGFYPRYDFLYFITEWPLGVDRSAATSYLIFPKQFFEVDDFEAKAKVYTNFLRIILEEDLGMIRSLHKGVKSRAFRPGPLSKYEAAIHNIVNYLLERIAGGGNGGRGGMEAR